MVETLRHIPELGVRLVDRSLSLAQKLRNGKHDLLRKAAITIAATTALVGVGIYGVAGFIGDSTVVDNFLNYALVGTILTVGLMAARRVLRRNRS